MVPTLMENCRLGWRTLHCHRNWFFRKPTLVLSHRGYTMPSFQLGTAGHEVVQAVLAIGEVEDRFSEAFGYLMRFPYF